MEFRLAQLPDSNQIAFIHAHSWRCTYRGLFSDDFLDNHADTNRNKVWTSRLSSPVENQFVYVAEQDSKIAGFICAYGHEHPSWGSLIDNLHVSSDHQRNGIGTQLMMLAFDWLKIHYPQSSVYLWVMSRNAQARRFYERLGAKDAGEVDKPNPVGGGSALNRRYLWKTPDTNFR